MLTFDDGPCPPTTPKVLAALAQECVHATFFLIGKPASEHPDTGQADRGRGPHHRPPHLVASQHGADPARRGEERDRPRHRRRSRWRCTATSTTTPSTPFFRFPYFEIDAGRARPAAVPRHRRVRGRSVGQRLERDDAAAGIEARHRAARRSRKGIILFHDPKARTAAMLPAFLRYLRDNGYRVVHIVPAGTSQKSADAR